MRPSRSVGGDERLRLFLALRLPDDAADAVERWQHEALARAVADGARRVAREHLHVTLAFLGSRPAGELEAIGDELCAAAAAAGPIRLTPARYRETRGAAMLVLDDADGAGARLAGDVGERLERLGVFRREDRPWLPHVTVLRYRARPRVAPPVPSIATWAPSEAAAYLSRLHPSGARYEVVRTCAVQG